MGFQNKKVLPNRSYLIFFSYTIIELIKLKCLRITLNKKQPKVLELNISKSTCYFVTSVLYLINNEKHEHDNLDVEEMNIRLIRLKTKHYQIN